MTADITSLVEMAHEKKNHLQQNLGNIHQQIHEQWQWLVLIIDIDGLIAQWQTNKYSCTHTFHTHSLYIFDGDIYVCGL